MDKIIEKYIEKLTLQSNEYETLLLKSLGAIDILTQMKEELEEKDDGK